MSEDRVEPTNEEVDFAGHNVLCAAFNALDGIEQLDDDSNAEAIYFKKSLHSIRAAKIKSAEEERKFMDMHPGKKCRGLWLDVEHIACSAMALKILGCDSVRRDAAYHSVIGQYLMQMTRAIMACEAAAQLDRFVIESEVSFAYGVDDALKYMSEVAS